MPRYKGAHLTWNDRLTIEKMLREGYSKPQIARYLGVHHSTVYDECRRGAVELKRSDLTTYISYSADVAKDYHLDRKKNMEKPLKNRQRPPAGPVAGQNHLRGVFPVRCLLHAGQNAGDYLLLHIMPSDCV